MSMEDQKPKEGPRIKWVYPDVEEETGEVERTARLFSSSPETYSAHFSKIMSAIHNGRFTELTETMWSKLENTDSYSNVRPDHPEDVHKLARECGRDSESLLRDITKGTLMKAPIIIIKKDGTPYLISGNTRLMLARALGSKVQALIARL